MMGSAMFHDNHVPNRDFPVELLSPFAIVPGEKADDLSRHRYDTKFILPKRMMPELLGSLSPSYRLICFHNQLIQNYRTIYFDDADFSLYHDHQRGKLNRFKIRMRNYPSSACSYLEIKTKTNHHLTKKSRFSVSENQFERGAISSAGYKLLQDFLNSSLNPLAVTIANHFTRIAMVSTDGRERLTFDMDLRFGDFTDQTVVNPGDFVVAEIKQSRQTANSAFRQLMKKFMMTPRSFSKYCFGVYLLYPQIKHNLFKESYRSLGERFH